MKTLTFKTTINCGGCVKAVTPHLNRVSDVTHWQVDTDHSDKLLRVESATGDPQEVIKAVRGAGFEIEPV